jgi:hypothetical protein
MSAVAPGLRAALWVTGLTLAILALSSLFHQPLTTAEVVALSCFAILSLLRPLDALLVLAALGPLISVIGVLAGFVFTGSHLLETSVLLLLTPWIARQVRWIREATWRPLDWALVGFAAIVATSAAAHLPVVALRHGTDSAGLALWRYLTTTYLARPAGYDVINEAVLLLEGIGLCAMISRLASDSRNAHRVAAMAVAGAAGAAAMNAYRLLEVALRRGPLSQTLGEVLSSVRINTQFGDLNAAGSYFAMAFVAAVGLSDLRSRRGVASAAAALPLGLALWLSGSRTALAGALLGVGAVLIVRQRHGASGRIRPRHLLLAAVALASVTTAVIVIYPAARNVSVHYSVWARLELTAAGLRMLGDRPLLGVGVSRFYELFPQYASPELRQKFFESALRPVIHENAHNNFLQILAELGIAGFAAFVAILWLALRPDKLNAGARLRSCLVAAVGAFLFSALFGHPLLTHEVAYGFWIVVGVCAAGSLELSGVTPAPVRRGMVVFVGLLVAAMPLRAAYERREATLEGVALGMSNWRTDESGHRFRWARPRSTLFLEPQAPVLILPLKTAGSDTCTVEISIDGRTVDRVTVLPDLWREVRLRLPQAADDRRSLQLDLIVAGDCADAAGDPARTLMVGRPGELGGR